MVISNVNVTSLGARFQRHRIAFSLAGTVLASAVILPACNDFSGITGGNTDVATTANLLVVSTPATGNVLIGATRRYKMEILNQHGAVMNAAGTFTVQWSIVGTPGVASIAQSGSSLDGESSGLATCLAAGTVTVHGVRGELSADATLTCFAPPSDLPVSMGILVTSSPTTGPVTVGTTRQYAIQVRNSANAVIPGLTSATWSIVGTAGVATITANGGLATCATAGTVTVHAVGPSNFSGTSLTADTTLQCAQAPKPAAAIVLTPWTVTAAVGGTGTATATFVDAGGAATTNGCPVGFTIDAGGAGSATVSGRALTATVTGSNAGRATLRAACTSGGTLSALARVEVTQAPLNVARVMLETRFHYFPTSSSASTFRFVATAQNAAGASVPSAPIAFSIAGGSAATTDQLGNVTVVATAGGAVTPGLRGGAVLTATSGGQTEVGFVTYGNAGTISGRATSTLGQYVGGTTVTATNTVGGAVTSAGGLTNDGNFYIVGLNPGTYTVTLTGASGQVQTFANVVVTAGQETTVAVTPFAVPARN